MSYQNPHRKSFITFMTVISVLAMVPTLWAQTERRKLQGAITQKVLIFKSEGASLPANRGLQPSAPFTLSIAEKNQVLKRLNLTPLTGAGSAYVRLNPRDPYVADKGFLNFMKVKRLDGDGDSGVANLGWGEPKDNVVEIHLKAEAAGRRYLIDSFVGLSQGQGQYKTWNGNGDLLQTIEGSGPSAPYQHLLLVLEVTDDGWHELRISGGKDWWFYSCEVTSL